MIWSIVVSTWIAVVAQAAHGAVPSPRAKNQEQVDGQILRLAKIAEDPSAVRQYLLDNCGKDANVGKVESLIGQLGADTFIKRQEAQDQLVGVGGAALQWLHPALRSRDREVAVRAQNCLLQITKKRGRSEVLCAAVRWLLSRRVSRVAETLLQFIPYAGTRDVEEEIWFGLDAFVAGHDKLDSVFRRGLRDQLPVRRALSGYLLAPGKQS